MAVCYACPWSVHHVSEATIYRLKEVITLASRQTPPASALDSKEIAFTNVMNSRVQKCSEIISSKNRVREELCKCSASEALSEARWHEECDEGTEEIVRF